MKLFRSALVALLTAFACVSVSSAAWDPNLNTQIMVNSAVSSVPIMWPGGVGSFDCVGTWNGATVTLQLVGSDGTTLENAGAAATLTANGNANFWWRRGLMQATVTSAGGSTSLTCSIGFVQQ